MKTILGVKTGRWLVFSGLLTAMAAMGIAMTVAVSGNATVEVKADAENLAGDRLDVDVGGPSFTSLTGTAVLEKADGTVFNFVVDASNFNPPIDGTHLVLRDGVAGAGNPCGAVLITLGPPGPPGPGGPGPVPGIQVKSFDPLSCNPPAVGILAVFGAPGDELGLEIEVD